MHRYVLPLLAAASLLAATAGTAHAAVNPTGFVCGFSSVPDPTAPEGVKTFEADAALVLTDSDNALVLHAGQVSCLVKSGGVVSGVTGPVATGVVAVEGTITAEVAPGEDVSFCTRLDLVDGRALFWDDWAGDWSANEADCWMLGISVDPDPVPPIVGEVLFGIGPFYCPVSSIVFPPEGDVVLPVEGKVWDCPPYDV
jgi:hypothetical protein